MMRGGLNDNDQYSMSRVFALEDEETSPILSSNSPRNRFTSPEPIRSKERKTAKQSRKPTASAKFAGDKKTSKRSKQARVSVTDSSDLDVLQQTLSDYFRGQMQSTKDVSR